MIRLWIALILIGGLLLLSGHAAVIPLPNLDSLTQKSTLIVLGDLVSIDAKVRTTNSIDYNGRSVLARTDRGTLIVESVLKGTLPSGPLVYEFVVPQEYLGWQIPRANSYGVFFFQLHADGKASYADLYWTYIPVVRGSRGQGETALDRVTSVLSDTLSLSTNSDSADMALTFLRSSKSDASTRALRAALRNANGNVSLSAASALMLRGDGSGIEVVKNAFLPNRRAGIDRQFEEVIGNSISHLNDAALVSDLESLLNSPSVYIRRGASGSLRLIHSTAGINGLLQALDDSDFKVRYYATVGLAETTNQSGWRPNEQVFRSRESEFIQHWKEWARNR